MRDHAQAAMRGRSGFSCHGVVRMHGLHEAEAGYDQHEKHRHPFLERRTIELSRWLHADTTDITISKLDALREAQEAQRQ
jgi:hypothetical protein